MGFGPSRGLACLSLFKLDVSVVVRKCIALDFNI